MPRQSTGTCAGRRLGLAVLVAASSGCAFVDINVIPPRTLVGSGVMGGQGRELVLTRPFADARQNPGRCGVQKNGMGSVTATVHCLAAPNQYLADLLAGELQLAGFRVVDRPTGPNPLIIEGLLEQFFVEPYVTFFTFTPEADIGVRLVARSPSGLEAVREFYAKSEETSVAGPAELFQQAADRATRQIVSEMAAAIVALADRFPDVGRGPPLSQLSW